MRIPNVINIIVINRVMKKKLNILDNIVIKSEKSIYTFNKNDLYLLDIN